jgi:hypothetical protein
MYIWLRSKHNGKYVCAEGGGGSFLYANRGLILDWESFVLKDHTTTDPSTNQPRSYLYHGDTISMRATNGMYVCADYNRLDRALVADRPWDDAWERFTVEIIGGSSAQIIANEANPDEGTLVTLKASNGKYVYGYVGGGGDNRLYWGTGTTINEGEPFYLGYGGGNLERPAFANWRNMNPVQ